jgi:FixJ family two-component response regulator
VPNREPTVFIVDDDVSVREAIEAMVRSVGMNAQTFETPQDFLRRHAEDVPGCLVLDVRLPGVSGLEVQRQLAEAGTALPIVFITGFGDIPMSVRAMKAGAVEFLTKPFRDQDLLDAINNAVERDRAARQNRLEIAELRERFESLTERERQVMQLVIAGKLNKQIAGQLGTSLVTVKVHRGHVMQKMRATSAIDLARMADRLSLRPA